MTASASVTLLLAPTPRPNPIPLHLSWNSFHMEATQGLSTHLTMNQLLSPGKGFPTAFRGPASTILLPGFPAAALSLPAAVRNAKDTAGKSAATFSKASQIPNFLPNLHPLKTLPVTNMIFSSSRKLQCTTKGPLTPIVLFSLNPSSQCHNSRS